MILVALVPLILTLRMYALAGGWRVFTVLLGSTVVVTGALLLAAPALSLDRRGSSFADLLDTVLDRKGL